MAANVGVSRAQLTDSELEIAISAAYVKLCEAPTRAGKIAAWRQWVRLLDQRPPPSLPTRIEQSSVGCRGNAAGGGL